MMTSPVRSLISTSNVSPHSASSLSNISLVKMTPKLFPIRMSLRFNSLHSFRFPAAQALIFSLQYSFMNLYIMNSRCYSARLRSGAIDSFSGEFRAMAGE